MGGKGEGVVGTESKSETTTSRCRGWKTRRDCHETATWTLR